MKLAFSDMRAENFGVRKKIFWEILGLFLIWRIFLILVAYFGIGKFPIEQNFYNQGNAVDLFSAWANWDGGHYIGIAEHGYKYYFEYAFFPFYPILIKLSSFLTLGNLFWSAYLVSSIFTVGSLIFLYKLVKVKFDEEVAFRSLVYLLFFPTAFFLIVAYSESTYLFLSLAAFYFAIGKNWKISLFLGMLAVVTRPVGVFLILALGVEYLDQIKFDWKKINLKEVIWFLITPLGLLFFMYKVFLDYKDPFFFIKTQGYWHRSNTFLNPLDVLTKNTQNLFILYNTMYFQFIALMVDYIFTVIFLITSIFIFKKLSKSMGIYTFLLTFLPLSTGSLASESRFVLVLFPFFILMAKWGENRLVNFAYLLFGALFLSLFTVVFINGGWLA